ncbi:RNA polymerase sigma factor, partial [Fulvivirga sp. RKSG066]|uniref:RNA polymerase sigma factor n=1 Tax=Fulvivirga aurantia TaxID=2529383 RepID=UPI0012BC891D
MNKDKIFDELLVLKCRDGDKKAFELLIKRWHKKLISFSYKITHDLEASKDLVQESWISFHRGIRGISAPSKFSSWIYRVVYNKSIDYLRKHRSAEPQEIADEIDEGNEYADDRWKTIEFLLKKLPTTHKTILTLFYLEEHSIKEISEILQI